jgi:hypothetical protein
LRVLKRDSIWSLGLGLGLQSTRWAGVENEIGQRGASNPGDSTVAFGLGRVHLFQDEFMQEISNCKSQVRRIAIRYYRARQRQTDENPWTAVGPHGCALLLVRRSIIPPRVRTLVPGRALQARTALGTRPGSQALGLG